MILSRSDPDYNRGGEKEIEVVGKMKGSFRYDAFQMNKILNSVPDEELIFQQSDPIFYITGDSGFLSFITELK